MDDRRAQFVILVGDLCVGAGLAGLPVELETAQGEHLEGIPSALRGAHPGDAVDDTGYAEEFRLDGTIVALESVTACRLRVPD